MKRDLEDILDIQPIDKTKSVITQTQNALNTVQRNYATVFESKPDERFNEDFEDIRTSLKDLISETSDVVQKLSIIAQDSEKAAHFTALAQMSTTLLNANKQLLEIYSEKKRYHTNRDSSKDETSQINVQNAIFTGTTNDLKEWIKRQQEANS